MRTFYLLFHVQVGNALHSGNLLPYLLSEGIEARKVVAEDLDGNVCLRSRKHGIDAVGDGGPHLHAYTGNGG